MPESTPVALILLNMGGPDSVDAVEPYLYQLFSDRELIQLPAGRFLQKPFAKMISTLRAKKVRANYRLIGGKSPQREWTEKQAEGIAQRLGPSYRPYVIMRYWQPRAEQVLKDIKAAGIETAIVLSMYPHYTSATTGSSVNDFKAAVAAVHPELEFELIEQWYDWPPYLDALAQRVKQGLDAFHDLMRDDVHILFSAHALPQKLIDAGEPYQQQVEVTVEQVMRRVGYYDWSLAYQSRSGPVRWMRPGSVETIRKLGATGYSALLVVPVSFVSDHVETLEEIDHSLREVATRHGIVNFYRTASLNDGADFLDAMAQLVRERTTL